MSAFFNVILCTLCICVFSHNVPLHLPSPFLDYSPYHQRSNDKDTRPFKLHNNDIIKSYNFANREIGRSQRFENELRNLYSRNDDIMYGHYLESVPEEKAVDQAKDAFIATKTTYNLLATHCPYRYTKDCISQMHKYNLKSTPISDVCRKHSKDCSQSELSSKYRTFDGSCNNKNDGNIGQSFTAYKRLLPPAYLDGISSLRRSITKKELPSPRLVSVNTAKDFDSTHNDLTQAVMQWSEFIANDLAHTPASKTIHTKEQIECCDEDGWKLAPRHTHMFCLPIHVPDGDNFYDEHNIKCMTYVRSSIAIKPDCSLGPNDQINQATHFLDGSQVYGNTPEKARSLRAFHGGLLKSKEVKKRQYLPEATDPSKQCLFANKTSCFIAGDSRVNGHPQLTVMHTIWLREHNRIAEELQKINPVWDDETLYQEARRIAIAEVQHITYNEWLPMVLGNDYANFITNSLLTQEKIDPTVSNSFATAASRFMKSLIDNKLNLYAENRNVHTQLKLKDNYNNPSIIEQAGYLDSILRGLATQNSQNSDMNYAGDVIAHFHGNGIFGLDALSLDIQRGRDHGLPPYTEYRKMCGLKDVTSFEGFLDAMTRENIRVLSKVYADPRDVDLIIGAMSEKPINGSILGPTFTCLIMDQMLRTKLGDRYFYLSKTQPVPFSDVQLGEIEKVTLARIFCDNGDDIEYMQPYVFNTISSRNSLISCSKIPQVDLSMFSDYYRYNH